jgi:hypothetical protein
MSNTYTWKVVKLNTVPSLNNQTNVVNNVFLKVEATDGTNIVHIDGWKPIPFNASNSFISYTNLTESTVISWVQSLMTDFEKTELQRLLDVKISNLSATLPTNNTLPWSS